MAESVAVCACSQDGALSRSESANTALPFRDTQFTLNAPMPQRLSDLEIQRALGSLPGWARRGDVLTKSYTFPTFAAGIEFVQRIARAADEMNHHPDIDIRYTKILCTLSTHDAGGITQNDLDLAGQIEGLQ